MHRVRSHLHATAQHGCGVRSEHEFFGAVCDALDGVAQVLVTGSHTALADLRHYAYKHRPQTAKRIAAFEVVDYPNENQLVSRGRAFFAERARGSGSDCSLPVNSCCLNQAPSCPRRSRPVIEFVPVDSKERFTALTARKIDMECANSTITHDRRAKGFGFSLPYFMAGSTSS